MFTDLLHILLVKFLPIMGQSRIIICSWNAVKSIKNKLLSFRKLCFLPVLVVIAAACQTLTEVAHFQKVVCGF